MKKTAILPAICTQILVCLDAAQKQSGRKTAGYLVPLFFIISNLLFLLLYLIGVIPLSASCMILPALLIGYGIAGFFHSYFHG